MKAAITKNLQEPGRMECPDARCSDLPMADTAAILEQTRCGPYIVMGTKDPDSPMRLREAPMARRQAQWRRR